MSITGNWERRRLSRRDFLAMSGMGAAALALSTNGLLLPRTALAQIDYSDLRNPFTLGVASGDPLPDGVVLWTRLAPDPLNGGDMPNSNVKVDWQVAKDENFTDIVAGKDQPETRRPLYEPYIATPGLAHSVHVEVSGLDPGAEYYYRFTVGTGASAHPSTVGRTKTAPKPDSVLSQVKFAFASCQSYQAGYWAPFLDMANQDLDCVIHVGDYIYEYGTWTGYAGPWRLYQTAAPKDLPTYRNRHAEYKHAPYINDEEPAKTGEDWGLQEAHAAHPWICTWDDHEVVNDYAGGDLGSSSRRNAAYQAYYEHMPIRPSRIKKTDWSSVELHYDIAYGNLARFCVLDTRQYRTKHACKTTGLANCSDRFKETLSRKRHTILGRGDAQENWLKGALSESDRPKTTWKVLPNQVRMSEFDHEDGSAESYRMEEWDGYVATRNRISRHIYEGIQRGTFKNAVAITGDMHAAWGAELKYDAGAPDKSYESSDPKSIIGAEIAGTSACSDLGSWWKDTYTSATNENDNPHVKYLSTKEGGYVLCTVDAGSFEAQYRVVRDSLNSNGKPVDGRYDPLSPLDTIATATVSDGIPGLPDGSVSGVGSVSLASGVTAEEEPRERVPRVEPPRGRDTR